MKYIKIDMAPGMVASILSLIYTRMSLMLYIPKCFLKARTFLIHKGGDVNNIDNWRPITICSVLRRIFERILDSRIRSYVAFNPNQRGFSSCPGTYTNTTI